MDREASERRAPEGGDRRTKPTSPFSIRSLLAGRRRSIRRRQDRNFHYYVDRYDTLSVAVFLLVIALSVADGFITLHLVAAGAREINPVMRFFLSHGTFPFLLVKYCLTGFGFLFLIIHKEYYFLGGRLRGRLVMLTILLLYCVLIGWEIVLLSQLT